MAKIELTERQQYCLNHIRAASATNGTAVEYANAHDLKVIVSMPFPSTRAA